MPSNYIRENGYLRDSKTGCLSQKLYSDNPEENKIYAVILRCGHCGEGYFIPIMFTIQAKDVRSATDALRINPRVQRHKKDAVLAVFEITRLEQHFIEAINNHDPYLKGWGSKKDDSIQERRVYSFSEEHSSSRIYNKKLEDRYIKVQDGYNPFYVLERFFAPRRQGDSIIPSSKKFNKDELMYEFFTQNTLRYGIRKGNAFILALYYQQFGKGNELGVKYSAGYMKFVNEGKKWSAPLSPETDRILKLRIQELELEEKTKKQQEEMVLEGLKSKNRAIDKFNRRFAKHKSIVQSESGYEGREPNE